MLKAIIAIGIYVFFSLYGSDQIGAILKLISDDSYFVTALTNFITYIILLVVLFFLFKPMIIDDFKKCKEQNISFLTIFNGYLILLGAGIVGNVILIAVGINPGERESVNQQVIVTLMQSKYAFFMGAGALIAAFVEEMIYRHSVFTVLHEKLKLNPILVCFASGLTFGLIHVVFNIKDDYSELLMAIPYVFQGFALSGLYLYNKKNISVPILVHAFNNAISIIVILFQSLLH